MTSGEKKKNGLGPILGMRKPQLSLPLLEKERGNNGLLAHTMGGDWALLLQVLLWRESRKEGKARGAE